MQEGGNGKLEPQKHGGALNRGGRLPGARAVNSMIRRRHRSVARKTLAEIERRLEGEADTAAQEIATSDLIALLRTSSEYGVGKLRTMSDEEVRAKLASTVNVILTELEPAVAQRVLAQIEPFWRE